MKKLRVGYLKKYEKWDKLWKASKNYYADKALRELQIYVRRYGMYE